MKKICLSLIINGLCLITIAKLFAGVQIDGTDAFLQLTLIFGILNITLKPFLQLFSLPFTIITLGLFALVINTLVLGVAFDIVGNASIDGFATAFIASIVVSVVNSSFHSVFKTK